MKLTYFGHACFLVETMGKKILFDPFISPNDLCKGVVSPEDIDCDYILLSHGHGDHVADAVSIATRTGATCVAAYEVYEWLGKQGVTKAHPMNTGGKWTFDFGTVKCVSAIHSSGMPDGSYGGNPMGFVISNQEGSFYYSGDTALTLDMQLIPRWADLSFAVLPIGDNFTMDAEDAAIAATFCGAKKVVGVHYDTFGFIKIDHDAATETFANHGVKLLLPAIGETIEL